MLIVPRARNCLWEQDESGHGLLWCCTTVMTVSWWGWVPPKFMSSDPGGAEDAPEEQPKPYNTAALERRTVSLRHAIDINYRMRTPWPRFPGGGDDDDSDKHGSGQRGADGWCCMCIRTGSEGVADLRRHRITNVQACEPLEARSISQVHFCSSTPSQVMPLSRTTVIGRNQVRSTNCIDANTPAASLPVVGLHSQGSQRRGSRFPTNLGPADPKPRGLQATKSAGANFEMPAAGQSRAGGAAMLPVCFICWAEHVRFRAHLTTSATACTASATWMQTHPWPWVVSVLHCVGGYASTEPVAALGLARRGACLALADALHPLAERGDSSCVWRGGVGTASGGTA